MTECGRPEPVGLMFRYRKSCLESTIKSATRKIKVRHIQFVEAEFSKSDRLEDGRTPRFGECTLECVWKVARSGDRTYKTKDLRPFPVGGVPSRGADLEWKRNIWEG
jgi:hypothetical protein